MIPSIGILNLQQVDNYGCVLGAYALEKTIKRYEVQKVELIDYRPNHPKQSLIKKIRKVLLSIKYFGLIGTVKRHIQIKQTLKVVERGTSRSEKKCECRKVRFELFREHYFKRSSTYSTISLNNAPVYNIYLVGSDVVWLLDDLWLGQSPAFLNFTEGIQCKRVSYAASMGDMPYEFGNRRAVKHLYREGLRRFDMISVREEISAQYLSDLYPGKIWCCMDPTLLLNASDYEEICSGAECESGSNYIYVYMLDDTDTLYEKVNYISKITGLPVIRCCDQIDGYQNVIVTAEADGPAEFLNRIKNASLVITNSFHAVCFSLLYHKTFFAVKRTTQAYKTEELLRRLSLTERYLDLSNENQDYLKPIDYMSVEEKLNEWREESMDYLKRALTFEKELDRGGAD